MGRDGGQKGLSLSSYNVELILSICQTEKERGEKSPPNISIQFSMVCSHKSAKFTQTDLSLSEAPSYFRAGYHTAHGIF